MFCKYCGKSISDDTVFCGYCGKQTDNKAATTSNEVIVGTFELVFDKYVKMEKGLFGGKKLPFSIRVEIYIQVKSRSETLKKKLYYGYFLKGEHDLYDPCETERKSWVSRMRNGYTSFYKDLLSHGWKVSGILPPESKMDFTNLVFIEIDPDRIQDGKISTSQLRYSISK